MPIAATHLINDPFSVIKEQLQRHIISNLLYYAFAEKKLMQGNFINTNYETSFV